MLFKYTLPGIYLVLALISLATLKSIAPELAANQLIFFVLGGLIFFLTSQIKFGNYTRFSILLYLALCAGLLLTLVIGQVTKGSTRWIDVGGVFHIQPSQLAVPVVLLYLSTLITSAKQLSTRLLLQALLTMAIPAGLILIEPDLGTTLIFVTCVGVVIWLAQVQLRHLIWMVGGGLLVGALGWLMVLKPYQKDRIYSFLGSSSDPQASYNSRQAMIAVGSGQTWGRGLGQGIQSHLRFLPERQTDFIYASLAEEVGFIGSAVVILLYLILFFHLWQLGYHASDLAEKQYLYGILLLFLTQTFINVGMNMGLLPITGVTLPLISYGGSSILSLTASLGIVQSISSYQPKKSTLLIK